MASNGCAVGPDSKLLDASKIVWFHDADDDRPMAPATTSSTVQPQPGLSATTLDSFVTKGPPPARRSTHAARPSTKVIDPDNAMATKRKSSNALSPKPSRRLRQASTEPEEDNASEFEATESGSTDMDEDDPVAVNPGEEYEVTKALSNADRKVSVHFSFWIIGSRFAIFLKAMCTKSKEDRTADIHTIFEKTTDYIDPDTGKMLTGHYCLVCKYVFVPIIL